VISPRRALRRRRSTGCQSCHGLDHRKLTLAYPGPGLLAAVVSRDAATPAAPKLPPPLGCHSATPNAMSSRTCAASNPGEDAVSRLLSAHLGGCVGTGRKLIIGVDDMSSERFRAPPGDRAGRSTQVVNDQRCDLGRSLVGHHVCASPDDVEAAVRKGGVECASDAGWADPIFVAPDEADRSLDR
jgi:hypothetical protein